MKLLKSGGVIVKKRIKKIVAALLSVMILLSCMNVGAFAATYQSIVPGEVVTATADVKMGKLSLEFVPEETGAYAFYSMGEYDTYGYIFDSKMNLLAENDDYEDVNFRVQCYLTAGEKYILRSEFFEYTGEGMYSVSVMKLPEPEEIFIFHGGETVGYLDGFLSLECMAEPEGAYIGNCVWESDNEDVAIIDFTYESYCDVYFVGTGTANISVTTDTGLTDTVEIRGIETPDISIGSTELLSFGTMGGVRYFNFTPEVDGEYAIYTSGALVPSLILYDSDWDLIAFGESFGDMGDVVLRANLSANETYLIEISSYMESPDFELLVTESPKADGVQIISDGDLWGYRAMSIYLYPFFSPEIASTESCAWSSSNEDVAIVFENDGYCEVLLVEVGTAEITVTTESGLTDTVTVECLPVDEIKLNEEVKINAEEGAVYKFVPEHNGVYAFVSSGDAYAFGAVLTNGWDIIDGTFGESANFSLQAEMTRDTEYYVATGGLLVADDYTVKIVECEKATSVSFREGSVVYGHVGDELSLGIEFNSDTAIRENATFRSDNSKVVDVSFQDYGTECGITLNKAGSASITVETENGLTATCTVIVTDVEYRTLFCEETYTVHTDKYLYEYFEFTPSEDGRYSLYSKGDRDTFAEVFDENMNYMDEDDDSGSGNNFCLRLDLHAGEKYIFRTYCYDRTEDEYTVTMVKAKEADGMHIAGDRTVYADVGDMLSFSAEFTPDGADVEDVYWRVSDRSVIQPVNMEGPDCVVMVEGEGTAVITASTDSGYYDYITIVVGGREVLSGDVNGDGTANAQDANLLKRYLAGSFNDIIPENADMNSDGHVDAQDSNLIKRLLAGA